MTLLTLISCLAAKPIDMVDHLVQIHALQADGTWRFIGSGTYVEPKHIDIAHAVVTATHVPENETSVRACGWIKHVMTCEVAVSVQHSNLSPISLLELSGPVAKPARLSPYPLYYTEEVYGLGFPAGSLTMWRGQVINKQDDMYGVTGGHCDHGISGGPVFDTRGRLAGVFQAMPVYVVAFGDELPVHSICYASSLQ
jgi:hypothetical protein